MDFADLWASKMVKAIASGAEAPAGWENPHQLQPRYLRVSRAEEVRRQKLAEQDSSALQNKHRLLQLQIRETETRTGQLASDIESVRCRDRRGENVSTARVRAALDLRVLLPADMTSLRV